MRIRYTATARAEADEIFKHIARDNQTAATAVAAAIKNGIARLAAFPRIGAATTDPNVFTKIALPYHYLIFFSIDRDTVIIRRVRHPARRRPPSQPS
jgi:plasmid stabilization system protein ParE